MSDPCSWSQSPSICSSENSIEQSTSWKTSTGPNTQTHKIRTDYSMVVGDHIIPIVKTVRDFSVEYGITFSSPQSSSNVAVLGNSGYKVYSCSDPTGGSSTRKTTFRDTCVIEKSTLHYLDHRYGMCLYRYQKDSLDVAVQSDKSSSFRTTTPGEGNGNMVLINTKDYTAETLVEWRLVVDGKMTVLVTDRFAIHPFGVGNNGKSFEEMGYANVPPASYAYDFKPNKETREILVFPQPPSLAIALTPEIVRLGFYDYGNLPGEESGLAIADGGKDMFYPEWCRSLQEDPIWKAAAASKYNIFWFHTDRISATNYEPPPISVDPLPIGSFARHPVAGDMYQFLIAEETYSSPNIDKIIMDQVPDNAKKTGATLYYPISLM